MPTSRTLPDHLRAPTGPRCERCGGPSHRAVRTRRAFTDLDATIYLARSWACSVCGQEWADEAIERANAWAASVARAALVSGWESPRKVA